MKCIPISVQKKGKFLQIRTNIGTMADAIFLTIFFLNLLITSKNWYDY